MSDHPTTDPLAISDYDVIFPLKDKMLSLMKWHFVSTIFHQLAKKIKPNQTKTKPLIELILTCITTCECMWVCFFLFRNYCLPIIFFRFWRGVWHFWVLAHSLVHSRNPKPAVDFHYRHFLQLCTSGKLRVHILFFSATVMVVVIVHSAKLHVFALKHNRIFLLVLCTIHFFLLPIKEKSY